MADAHAHDEHGDDYLVHAHITSIKTYIVIFGALIFLTGLTVAAYNIRLGDFNLFVAVLIAMVKSSLVGAYFMHLKYEKKFNVLFFTGSLIFVGVFLAYTLNDTDHRGRESVQGLRIDPGTGKYAYGTALPIETQGEFTPFPPGMIHSEGADEAAEEAPESAEAPAAEAPSEAPPAEEASAGAAPAGEEAAEDSPLEQTPAEAAERIAEPPLGGPVD